MAVFIFKVWILWLPPRNGRIWMRKYGIVQNLSKGNTSLICLRSNYMHDQDILFWNDNAVNKSSKSLNAHLLLFQIFIAPWLIGEKAIVPILTCNINTLCYKKLCGFKFMSFYNEGRMCNSALNEIESSRMRKLLIFYQIIILFFYRMERLNCIKHNI